MAADRGQPKPPPKPQPLWMIAGFSILAGCISVLSEKTGGYGWIPWSLHPILMIAGVGLLLESTRISKYTDEPDKRSKHVVLSILATKLLIGGYLVAYGIKQAKGSSHFAAGHSLIRQGHAWAGWILLAGLVVQVLNGLVKQWGAHLDMPSEARARVSRLHNALGPSLGLAFTWVLVVGLYMMLVEKPLAVDWLGTVLSSRTSVFAVCALLFMLQAQTSLQGAGRVVAPSRVVAQGASGQAHD